MTDKHGLQWVERLPPSLQRELNTGHGRYSAYLGLCKYTVYALTFPFSVSSLTIAISYGHYRPAQPVRPLCEHSSVKVEREREFDRQKERERLEKRWALKQTA